MHVPMAVETVYRVYIRAHLTLNGHSQPVLKKLVSINIAVAVFSAVCQLRETNLDHVVEVLSNKNSPTNH